MEKLLPLLVQVRVCLVVIGGEIPWKMEMVFFVVAIRFFFATQCVPSPPNNIVFGFWS